MLTGGADARIKTTISQKTAIDCAREEIAKLERTVGPNWIEEFKRKGEIEKLKSVVQLLRE